MALRELEYASTSNPSISRKVTRVARTEGSSSTRLIFSAVSVMDPLWSCAFQYQCEPGAAAGFRLHLDGAAMLGNDLFHDRQPNSGSGLAGLIGASGSIDLLENADAFFI